MMQNLTLGLEKLEKPIMDSYIFSELRKFDF